MSAIQQLITEHINIWTAADTEKKSGRGRASGNAGSVYGIKKLRELILELAVRGKLVPQDPNDEPASELLQHIQAEKAKLVAEGKIKKDKPLELIGEDEKPFELPHGWVFVRNYALFQLRKGRIPKSLNEDELGLPYLDIDALDRNIIRRYSEELTCPQSTDKDILVVCDGSRSGLVLDGKNGIIGSTLSIIDTPVFIQNYIKLIFKQGFEIFNTSMKGAAIPHLDTQKLLQNPTALPPLAEQHRIVTKVDELMALCDQLEAQHSNAAEAHEKLVSHLLGTLTQSQTADDFSINWQRIAAHFDTLFTTEASMDALKQTLLQLAVMGKLVPQDPNDEPASELLERIQVEKAKLIAEGKLKKEKPLSVIGDDEKPYELPKRWEWTTLSGAAVINPRNNAPDHINASFVPMTLIGSAYNEKHQDEKRSWRDIKQGFTHFAENDIGVAKITPCFENSKACVFENLENGLGAGTTELHVVRPITNTLNPRYVLAYLKTPRFLEEGESKMTGTAGQKRLPKDFVEMHPFPLPPLSEQHRIVSKIDELMTLCDQLKTCIQQANQQQQVIADVLVAQALN